MYLFDSSTSAGVKDKSQHWLKARGEKRERGDIHSDIMSLFSIRLDMFAAKRMSIVR